MKDGDNSQACQKNKIARIMTDGKIIYNNM